MPEYFECVIETIFPEIRGIPLLFVQNLSIKSTSWSRDNPIITSTKLQTEIKRNGFSISDRSYRFFSAHKGPERLWVPLTLESTFPALQGTGVWSRHFRGPSGSKLRNTCQVHFHIFILKCHLHFNKHNFKGVRKNISKSETVW